MLEVEQLKLAFKSIGDLQTAYDNDLRHLRAIVPGKCKTQMLAACKLAIRHPVSREQLVLDARVVSIIESPPAVCLELMNVDGLDDAWLKPKRKPTRAMRHEVELSKLSRTEQTKLARNGEVQQRVTLERMFGKAVWDALLRNPRITIPEVARIARKGTVPRPLLDLIVENSSWAKTGPVRRALLSNPRMSTPSIMRVLQMTPKNELKLVEKQLSYPASVRQAARRLLAS